MRRNNSLNIDLTPLLDVILIILFLVLMTGHQQTEQAVTKSQQEAQRKIRQEQSANEKILDRYQRDMDKMAVQVQQLEKENRLLQRLNDTDAQTLQAFEVLVNQSTSIKISVPDDYPQSAITVTDLKRGSKSICTDNNMLIESLKRQLKSEENIVFILVFEYNSKKILLKEYRKINQSILQLRADFEGTILYREVNRAEDLTSKKEKE